MRLNLNGGWLWDRSVDRHYLPTASLRLSDEARWTIEAFGQAGQSVRQRAQPSFDRHALPAQRIFSVDLIYGRNISGENANWITQYHDPFPGARRQAGPIVPVICRHRPWALRKGGRFLG
jgi:hypothetical protein